MPEVIVVGELLEEFKAVLHRGGNGVSERAVAFESRVGLVGIGAGVSDPDNRLRGSLVWHPGWGEGIFPVIGAKNFRVERFGEDH